MEACGMTFIKYILFVFNLVFAFSGLVIIIVASVVLANVDDYSHFIKGQVVGPPIVLIVVGVVVFIIAFLGCCGAIKEHYHMLMAFAVFLLIVFVVELAVGIAAAVAKDDFSTAMREQLKTSMNNYTKSQVDRDAWDSLQRNFKCCGVESARGWASVVGDKKVPASCCPNAKASGNPPTCPMSTDEDQVYQTSCYERIKMTVKDNIIIIMGIGIGMAFIELAGVILACCLASSIKKEQEAK